MVVTQWIISFCVVYFDINHARDAHYSNAVLCVTELEARFKELEKAYENDVEKHISLCHPDIELWDFHGPAKVGLEGTYLSLLQ